MKDLLQIGELDPLGDVELLFLPEKEQVPALRDGLIQALLAHHPHVETAIVDVGAVLLVHLSRSEGSSHATGPMPWFVLATTPEYRERWKDPLLGMVRGLLQAQQAIQDNPESVAKVLRPAFTGLSTPVFEEAIKINFPAVPQTPLITAEGLANSLTAALASPVPFEQVIDNSLVEQALQR